VYRVDELRKLLRDDQISYNKTILEHHSRDESYHTPQLPQVVVFPETVEDVQAVLGHANAHQIPVTPFAVGSSLEGQVIPVRGGISLDMTRMNKILEVRPRDFLVRVQPGVTKEQLNTELARHGLFFSVDPGADATIGGMAATNASGTTTVRYGVMRDQIRSIQVVLPSGQVIDTGSMAAKSASGLNLTGLFVGSEGTLGVFTEFWLKVYGLPETAVAARATFASVEACVKASTAVMGAGIPVTRLELVDDHTIAAVNQYRQTDYPVVPTLFLEFQGNSGSVQQDVELTRELMMDEGCESFAFEQDERARRQLWEARHIAALAVRASVPGKEQMVTDVCVPLSYLPEAVQMARETIDHHGITGALVGHVGDGNYHAILLVDPTDANELAKAYEINEKLVQFALSVGGTCTGEHGVGIGKRKYQAMEHGEAMEVMRSIKQVLDPQNVMNPGKLIGD
jgi:D-lactate dehydrogenase (cytochrome)